MRKFTISENTAAIASVFRSMSLGGTMTYKALSDAVGFRVDNGNPHYRSASDIVLKEGISIAAHESRTSFRRRTHDEMAEGTHRIKRITNQAKRGAPEAREAMKSNDIRTQGKASIAAAKYAMISRMKPTSNKDVVNDKI